MVVISISGKPGCGSSTTGQLLAKKLGLRFYSIGKYHKSFGSSKKETERTFEAWRLKKDIKSFEHEKDALSRRLATEGNVVIEGKLSIKMNPESDLKIWLTAPEKVRAERYSKRDGTSIEEALQILKKKEAQERETWKNIYGFDYFDQEKLADIVIDTGNKNPDQIVDIIVKNLDDKKSSE